MQLKLKVFLPEIIFGALLTVAVFALGASWSALTHHAPGQATIDKGGPNEAEQKAATAPTEDLIFGYPALDVFTGVLAFATIGLGIISLLGIRQQIKDTRIIQRAYISANPLGIAPFERLGFRKGDKPQARGNVGFANVGRLPARNVRWFINLKFSECVEKKDFPVEEAPPRSYVIPPGTEMRQWKQAEITGAQYDAFESRKTFLYVWGQIWYEDGFGRERFTKFCHRYERTGLRETEPRGPKIVPEDGGAVYHQYGNDAD